MNKTALALIAFGALCASALAQTIAPGTNPIPGGGAFNTSPPTILSGQAGWLQIDSLGNLRTTSAASGGAFPSGATPIQGNAAGTTGAVVGTLAGVGAKTTYICDFDISAIGGTAAVGPITVAGLLGGSKVYQLTSSATGVFLAKNFAPCLPASAVNTAITITTTANGTATAVDVNSSGYQQ